MLHLVPPDGVDALARPDLVDDVAVRAGDDGGVVLAFRAAFQLDAVDARVHDVVQMVDHAHIAGVHDVGTLLVLEHGEILPGALLLHQGVLIAAGLRALAAVGIAAGHVVRQQAAPAVAHAHRAVGEGLKLQLRRHVRANFAYFLQRQLPRQHDALCAEVVPRLSAGGVGDALLGGDVPLALRRVLPRQREHAEVGEDQRVHTRVVQQLQMLRQRLQFVAAGHRVHRDVRPDAVIVGKAHRLAQLVGAEVARERPHAEAGAREVHRVRAVEHRHAELFHIARRSEEFRLSSHPA